MIHGCSSVVVGTTGGTRQVMTLALSDSTVHSSPPIVSRWFFAVASVWALVLAQAPVSGLRWRHWVPSPR